MRPIVLVASRSRNLTLLVAMLFALACGGSNSSKPPSAAAPPSGSVGPAGGTVTSADGRASLEIPRNAVATDTLFEIAPASVATAGQVGSAYQFTPPDSNFAVPATLTIHYDPAALPAGTPESDLRLGLWTGTQWQDQAGTLDTSAKTIRRALTQFGVCAIVTRQALNHAPVAESARHGTSSDAALEARLAASDADGDSLTYRIVSPPSVGSATLLDAATGDFRYTPQFGSQGSFAFSFEAEDEFAVSQLATVTIDVTAAPPLRELRVSVVNIGSGRVILGLPEGGGIWCGTGGTPGSDCSEIFELGTDVMLIAVPTHGSPAVSWEGCDDAFGYECSITMNANRNPVAHFVPIVSLSLPSDDVDGTYALRWGCIAPVCSAGDFLIEQASDESFQDAITISHRSPPYEPPGSGVYGISTPEDGRYCYRVRPSSVPIWSETRCIHVDSIERESVSEASLEGNAGSAISSLSAYGRHAVFGTSASNLVRDDEAGHQDVVIRYTRDSRVRRVLAAGGAEPDGDSFAPVVTPDGRFVAFLSAAKNLVESQTTGLGFRAFVRDTHLRTTEEVSLANDGSAPDGNVGSVDISADGRFVAFHSSQNLANADESYGLDDVYVRDRLLGQTRWISDGPSGQTTFQPSQNAAISYDGHFVAFTTKEDSMFAGDTNGRRDIVRVDLTTGARRLVSLDRLGGAANGDSYDPHLSGDGRYVIFSSMASNLVDDDTNGCIDIFVKDMDDGGINRPSVGLRRVGWKLTTIEGNDHSRYPAISVDGEVVSFTSWASNLRLNDANGQPDVYMATRENASLTEVSRRYGRLSQGDGFSLGSRLSPEGLLVGFISGATNLVDGDQNDASDAFVWSAKNSMLAPNGPDDDDDLDGLSNLEELTQYFTLHFKADTDGDGHDDGSEVLAGSDPRDPTSRP